MPTALPPPVTLTNVPSDRTPFQDALIGDASGGLFYTTQIVRPPDNYALAIYDAAGMLRTTTSGQFADASHPRVLPQHEGFLLLEGSPSNFPRLNKYSSLGAFEGTSGGIGAEHIQVATSTALDGGALVLSEDPIAGAASSSAWRIFAQPFDEAARPRAAPTLIAQDPTGATRVGVLAGAITVTGRIFVMWVSYVPGGPDEGAAHGAWLSQDGTVGPSMDLGTVEEAGIADVQPLVGGGVAVASSTLPSSYAWLAQVRDGANTPDPAGWLSAFPFTRMTRIRGGRAYAVLRGTPFWPAEFAEGPCELSMKIPLIGSDGATCGTLELPIKLDPSLTCTTTANSATLARDGTVLVQTRASATDASGVTHQLLFGTLWPKVLQ